LFISLYLYKIGTMGYFKYTNSKFVSDMLSKGRLKIGTLREYQASEKKEIGDKNEGKALGSTHISGGTYGSTKELPGVAGAVLKIEGNVKVNIKDITFQTEGEVPDAYIYSLTTMPLKKVMEHFDCDTCIKIKDIQKFWKVIADVMYNAGYLLNRIPEVGKCIYKPREVAIQKEGDARKIYWLKDPSFAHQQEYRIVMYPITPTITFKILDFPGLSGCLELFPL
jgi:hypothetical protein